jgi:uncharacterized protein YbjT (DUF2867 family)
MSPGCREGRGNHVKVVVVGATGNVGTAVIRALTVDESVSEILGIARRRPEWEPPKTSFVAADIARDDLVRHLRGAAPSSIWPGCSSRHTARW